MYVDRNSFTTTLQFWFRLNNFWLWTVVEGYVFYECYAHLSTKNVVYFVYFTCHATRTRFHLCWSPCSAYSRWSVASQIFSNSWLRRAQRAALDLSATPGPTSWSTYWPSPQLACGPRIQFWGSEFRGQVFRRILTSRILDLSFNRQTHILAIFVILPEGRCNIKCVGITGVLHLEKSRWELRRYCE